MTTRERIEEFGPVIYRMLACEKGVALSHEQIAERSGLSRSTVQRLSGRKDWSGVGIATAFAFTEACGIELGDVQEIRRRLKPVEQGGITAIKHLRISGKDPLWKRGANSNRVNRITNALTG